MKCLKISIITVCYNAVETIEETIKSVTNQSYKNIEYIVIDGGSNDGTQGIITRHNEHISKWVSEKDNGIYDAMNKGLNIATGDWVYFLGSDDVLDNNMVIEEMVANFSDLNTNYYGDVYWKNSKILYQFKTTRLSLCLKNISHQSLFYCKNYYKNNVYNCKYKLFADHIYNIQMYASDERKVQYVPKLVAIYTDGGRSSTANDELYFHDLPSIVKNFFGVKYAVYVFYRLFLFNQKRHLSGFIKKYWS